MAFSVSSLKDQISAIMAPESLFQVRCVSDVGRDNLEKVVNAIIRIQKSINWNAYDLRIATKVAATR